MNDTLYINIIVDDFSLELLAEIKQGIEDLLENQKKKRIEIRLAPGPVLGPMPGTAYGA